jgi:uncharacterized protein
MLYLLSPAKSLDYETPVSPAIRAAATTPQFLAESAQLIGLMKTKSATEVAELMDLSVALAELNVARYRAWSKRATERNSKPAVLAFNGDVYDGLQAPTLSTAELAWAQQHVAILSGLYGVLRPLDRLQPYRLEMGTALANPRGRNLYAWWGDTLAAHLAARVARHTVPVIVNLASQEYFRAADRPALKVRVIDCVFEDWHNGGYQVIGFFAKRARGAMARFAITQRLAAPEPLTGFKADGYRFAPAVSAPDRLVFRRRLAR